MTRKQNFGAMLVALLLGFSATAYAGISEVRKQAEASMLVTGMVMIEPDGAVGELRLDQPDKLPPGVLTLLDQAGKAWRFEPHTVDGVAHKAKARMSLRVVAKKLDSGDYALQLRSAYFGKEAMSPEERVASEGTASIQSQSLKPPQYPEGAMYAGARGIVYLILKIGPDGRTQEAAVEQVNLQVLAREDQMAQFRDQFGKSALRASKLWTFQVPSTGPLANDPAWVVRIPVSYQMPGYKEPGYGEWEVYVPGPKKQIPWAGDEEAADPDAMIAGGLYPAGQGMRLLTPLQSG